MNNQNTANADSAQVRPAVRPLWPTLFVALVVSFASACTQAIPLDVRVDFDSGNCPTNAVPDLAKLYKSGVKKITWTAHDSNGMPAAISFEIFFDPFKGRPHKTTNGVLTSPPLDTGMPDKSKKPGNSTVHQHVNFKYTILGTNCVSKVALDPRIRVSQ